jgi:hypothetical protein
VLVVALCCSTLLIVSMINMDVAFCQDKMSQQIELKYWDQMSHLMDEMPQATKCSCGTKRHSLWGKYTFLCAGTKCHSLMEGVRGITANHILGWPKLKVDELSHTTFRPISASELKHYVPWVGTLSRHPITSCRLNSCSNI